MSNEIIAIFMLFGLLFLFLFLRIPIAFSLGLTSVLTALYLDISLFTLVQKMLTSLNSFTFLAVPFFIIAAEVMTAGGISDKLLKLSSIFVGKIRGGTSIINIVVSMFFGGISGSSSAATSSIGTFLIPKMKQEGYGSGFSAAVTVTGSVQGVIIPPSQNMIYYCTAAASGLSISKMFVAGYIPGIMLGLVLILLAYFISVKKGYPISEKTPLKGNWHVVSDSLLGLSSIIIIIGGILLGIFTATESAAVAAVYSILISSFVYKKLSFHKLIEILKNSIGTLAIVMGVIAMSAPFGYMLNYLKVPTTIASALLSLTDNSLIIMLTINIILLIFGMFMDMGVLILLLTPIFLPIAESIGYDPYHFGIIMILNLGIGLCTPPVGTSLFIGCAIAKTSVEEAIKDFIPFYIAMIGLLFIIIVFPEISLWLPQFTK